MRHLLHLVVTAALTSAAGPAAETVPRILDATPEYCRSLAGRLAALPVAQVEPLRSLGEEGVKLCGDGHVRTGVTKLRRAIRAAQAQASPAATAAGAPAEAQGVTR
jgi:hypothetical protein